MASTTVKQIILLNVIIDIPQIVKLQIAVCHWLPALLAIASFYRVRRVVDNCYEGGGRGFKKHRAVVAHISTNL